ncbi:MAG TPA: FAD-dependent oxidoreductase, partial [Vicinamibacterales bacterium]|nr:FAD-dependent oxidoreductase [Vicinamibacterales bacterium]
SPASRALRAIYLPGEGAIPSARLLRAVDAALDTRASVERVDAEAVSLMRGKSAHHIALSNGQILSCGRVLLANGAAAQPLIDQVPELESFVPRLFYGVGCGLVLRPPSNLTAVVRTNNRGLACGLHAVPDVESGTCYVGASNFICERPESHGRAVSVATLLNAAMEQINVTWYKAALEEVRVGHRPTSADLFPLIGPTSVDGLFILSGTKRDGLYMSPVYARAMSQSLLTGARCFDGVFAPERALITTMTREEGIARAVAHLWSGGYQHDLRLPHAGWEGRIDNMLRAHVIDAYERAGNPDYGIPPELLDMYRYQHITPGRRLRQAS